MVCVFIEHGISRTEKIFETPLACFTHQLCREYLRFATNEGSNFK